RGRLTALRRGRVVLGRRRVAGACELQPRVGGRRNGADAARGRRSGRGGGARGGGRGTGGLSGRRGARLAARPDRGSLRAPLGDREAARPLAARPRSSLPVSFVSTLTGSFSTPAGENPTVAMVEAAYRDLGVDARYLNCEVPPDALGDAVRGARAMGWVGFNLSIPHKVAVIECLDGLGDSAEVIGAVNC